MLERDTEIAAPSMFYQNGTYFLATEINDRGWMTLIFEGKTPFGPFAPVAGNPVMGDNQACFFQHPLDGVLVGTLCKDMGPAGWQVNIRTAALANRVTYYTTMAGSEAATEALKHQDDLEVVALQELHAELN